MRGIADGDHCRRRRRCGEKRGIPRRDRTTRQRACDADTSARRIGVVATPASPGWGRRASLVGPVLRLARRPFLACRTAAVHFAGRPGKRAYAARSPTL